MALAQNIIAPPHTRQSLSGLQLLLLEDAPLPGKLPPEPAAPVISPLHRQLIALCLHNPYWNDFRILNHFQQRNTPLTMEDLRLLKVQCGLDNRETICNTLIRLAVNGGLKLNDRQLSFIGKNKPEFRDRDLQSSQPGELLVYECLFGRGLGHLGRVYVHLFVDIFTGYAFGELSQHRSLTVGLQSLLGSILPLYRAHNYFIQTIAHSCKALHDINEFNQLEADEAFSQTGLQWQLTCRKFGFIEKFEKSPIIDQFFAAVPKNADSLVMLKPLFDHCLTKYNAANRLFARRDLLRG